MRLVVPSIAIMLCMLSGAASAATLVLHDGSVIKGDIRTLQNDIYTIETESLGTVQVPKQDVRSIDLSDEYSAGTPSPAATSPAMPGAADLEALQLRVMQDPSIFAMVQALQNDPEIQAIMSDPAIMSAIAAGDITTLMNHPRIIALTDNPKVRAVIEEAR